MIQALQVPQLLTSRQGRPRGSYLEINSVPGGLNTRAPLGSFRQMMFPATAPAGAGRRIRAGPRDSEGDAAVRHTPPKWAARSISRCGCDTARASHRLSWRPFDTAADVRLHSPNRGELPDRSVILGRRRAGRCAPLL
ncbi:hypothetical protein NDU88_003128 [Pleurodeles waltl]|uniref:Uncharacterized protein n=1 Tax=Pleurodeles waltl TaxID=8319 RepID=A0AAV7RGI6_PLEWA|nr:hypothetical protein NDU88_003128 [Pleurodeles waltl]